MMCCLAGRAEVVTELVEQLTLARQPTVTALTCAVTNGHDACVAALLRREPDAQLAPSEENGWGGCTWPPCTGGPAACSRSCGTTAHTRRTTSITP